MSATWRSLPFRVREGVVRTTQTTFTVGVSAVLVNPRCEVLLTRHRFRYATSWQLPGGFVTRGETLEAAILRELREELRVDADVRRQIRTKLARPQHLDICFLCKTSQIPQANETELLEARFFTSEQLPEPIGEDVAEAIREALSFARSEGLT